jgi:Immunity protein 8
MKAELKGLHSPDIYDLENYSPKNSQNFSFLLQLMIGPEGVDGEESFDVQVCTPEWIKSQYSKEKCVWGRHMLIVLEYDFTLIKNKVEHYIRTCSGSDWAMLALKLGRIGYWEFEDYQ